MRVYRRQVPATPDRMAPQQAHLCRSRPVQFWRLTRRGQRKRAVRVFMQHASEVCGRRPDVRLETWSDSGNGKWPVESRMHPTGRTPRTQGLRRT